jgi:hypothetical protein
VVVVLAEARRTIDQGCLPFFFCSTVHFDASKLHVFSLRAYSCRIVAPRSPLWSMITTSRWNSKMGIV